MLKILKLIVPGLLFSFLSMAQEYRGKVLEMETGLPIQNANVFFAGTSKGTTTMPDGGFTIDAKGNFSIPLVISFIGYKVKTISIYELEKYPIIGLEKDNLQLDEVEVKSGKSDWPRNRMLQVFKEEFLGRSTNAQACKIKNEDDIYLFYNEDMQTLHARSQKPLIIENKLLGYTIYYSLEYFRKSEKGIQFKGFSRFEEIEFKNDRQKRNIESQRIDAYLGSIMHFMRYLYNNNISDPDTVYDIGHTSKTDYFLQGNILVITEKVQKNFYDPENMDTIQVGLPPEINEESIFNQFHLHDSTGNYLTIKPVLRDENNTRKLCYKGRIGVIYYPKFTTTYLVPKSDCIEISENGYYDPEKIGWIGSMAKKRVGDLLPFDYKYDTSILKRQ